MLLSIFGWHFRAKFCRLDDLDLWSKVKNIFSMYALGGHLPFYQVWRLNSQPIRSTLDADIQIYIVLAFRKFAVFCFYDIYVCQTDYTLYHSAIVFWDGVLEVACWFAGRVGQPALSTRPAKLLWCHKIVYLTYCISSDVTNKWVSPRRTYLSGTKVETKPLNQFIDHNIY